MVCSIIKGGYFDLAAIELFLHRLEFFELRICSLVWSEYLNQINSSGFEMKALQ